MRKEFQYIYNGARLTRVTGDTGLIGRIEAIAGTIKSIAVRAENVGSVGNFVFNVRKNNTPLLSGSDRLTVNSGAKRAEKTEADFDEITTVKGDLLSFSLDEVGAGGILGDLIFTIIIDDGIEADIAAQTHDATAKTTPVNNDEFALVDSAASNVLKKLTWSNIKATLKTYFDTLYQTILVSGTTIKTINSQSLLGSGDITISGGGGASALDDLTDVAITSPTTGESLIFDGTVWKNDSIAGQSGAILNADSPPLSPNAEDDEFLSPTQTLDSKWTKATIGTVTEDSLNDRVQSVYFIRLAPSGGLHLTQAFAPASADFSITLAGYIVPTNNYHNLSFGIKDGANAVLGVPGATGVNNYLQFSFEYSGGATFGVNKRVSNVDTFVVYTAPVSAINYSKAYLHLQRVGGVYEGYYSNNGTAWQKLFDSHSQSFTVTHLELVFETYGSSVKMQGGFDWIRRDWLFL